MDFERILFGLVAILAVVLLGLLFAARAKSIKQARLSEKLDDENKAKIAKLEQDIAAMRTRYQPIISVEEEVARLEAVASETRNSVNEVRRTYGEKRAILDQLEQQVALFDERISFAELGIYEPHFEFSDSEAFKAAITSVREEQKLMVKEKTAAIAPRDWTVNGSKAKGEVMVNRQVRLTMRAFNNECEAAIANVRWNNAVAMEKRILAAAAAIDKENTSIGLTIAKPFVDLRLKELRLTHEYREKQKAEREERAELVRAEREEKKLLADAEAADREEARYKALLDKARKEAEASSGGATAAMTMRIGELEKALREAHEASARARAMAEMTRSGYVYVISNVGSFGEDVVKIGLTRRLDPDDRVRELGDASVPFSFDVHAMIYSDDAPGLEYALHKEFSAQRVNLMNNRKEFFRVSLDEVERAVTTLAPEASFFKDREAQEWHETLSKRNQALQDMQTPASRFPLSI